MPSSQVQFSKAVRGRLKALVSETLSGQAPARDEVASWSNTNGTLTLGVTGFVKMTAFVEVLLDNKSLATFPRSFLRTTIAHAIIDTGGEANAAVSAVETALNNEIGTYTVYIPFWNIQLEEDVRIRFGNIEMHRLGEYKFEAEIVQPFERMRSGLDPNQVTEEVNSVKNTFRHIPNVAVLPFTYTGAGKGAKDYVSDVADRVSDFLQFLIAPAVARTDVQIIDHRGAYFGRFSTFMPVVSFEPDSSNMRRLDSPNLRGFPYAPILKADIVREFESIAPAKLLEELVIGPANTHALNHMLIRAMQLFADGERAVSKRQAVVSYIGACEVFFNHRGKATLYTCTGIALVLGYSYEDSLVLAEDLYKQRSNAVHEGFEPDSVGPARRVAYQCIRYILENKQTLSDRPKIRRWIEAQITAQEAAATVKMV